jgi:hypothetical protein
MGLVHIEQEVVEKEVLQVFAVNRLSRVVFLLTLRADCVVQHKGRYSDIPKFLTRQHSTLQRVLASEVSPIEESIFRCFV